MPKHKKINPRRRPATMADIERAKKDLMNRLVDYAWSIMFMVLRDKEGFEPEDLKRVWEEIKKLSSEVNEGRVTIPDLKTVLKEEAGATLT